jgi:hypothetical protein
MLGYRLSLARKVIADLSKSPVEPERVPNIQ